MRARPTPPKTAYTHSDWINIKGNYSNLTNRSSAWEFHQKIKKNKLFFLWWVERITSELEFPNKMKRKCWIFSWIYIRFKYSVFLNLKNARIISAELFTIFLLFDLMRSTNDFCSKKMKSCYFWLKQKIKCHRRNQMMIKRLWWGGRR